MLRVTKLSDYGIVLMTHFAGDTGSANQSARDLACEVHLPFPMVSKILKILVRENLLVSVRGTKGGYSLARRPEAITVAQIISALEGPIALTECTDKVNGDCDLEHSCAVRNNWQRINAAISEALEKITLADMRQPLTSHSVEFSPSVLEDFRA